MASLPAHGTIILKEGYLMKRSAPGKVIVNWRRRYFRLQPGELLYFESPQEVAPRRRIPLGLDSTVTLTNDQGYSMCFALKSTTTADTFYVQAATETEKKAWVDAIFDVIRKAKDVLQQPEAVLPSNVHLNVRVVGARGLIAADTRGTSDSYCVVTLVDKGGHLIKETQKQTKTNKNDLSPVWNYDAVFGDVSSRKSVETDSVVKKIDLSLVDEIRFDLFDKDTYTKDECIGIVSVPMGFFKMSVASATSSETIDHWFQIAPPPQGSRPTTNLLNIGQNEKILNERDHGELHLVMSLSGEKLPDFFRSLERGHQSPKKELIANNFDETDNRLEVAVLAARGLVYVDPKENTVVTAINPMAEIHVLDIHKRMLHGETYRTGVQFRTTTPTFTDAFFVCGRHSQIDQAGFVKVTLLHAERGDKFIPFGSVSIDLNEVSAYKLSKWYPLESLHMSEEAKPPVGEVHLQLCLIGESRGEKFQKEATKRLDNAQFQLLLAERSLDGAKIACAEQGYQVRHPNFYGVNGYLHAAHAQLVQANKRHQTPDHVFQNRGSIEGYALLDIAVVGVYTATAAERPPTSGTYAKLEVEPAAAIIAGKKISKPYLVHKAKVSPKRKKSPTHRVLQHPEEHDGRRWLCAAVDRQVELNGGMVRQAIWGKKPLTAEVSPSRQRLGKNEQRLEKEYVMEADRPYLRVRVVSGHNLMAGDMNGYSDPYCTMFLTDTHDVPYKKEKKKTAVVSKTLNPVWQREEFTLGYEIDLNDAKTLLVHVKDHNNIGHATPLGRVEVPLQDLCQGSATTTSIASVAMTKRYPLVPEPWMKQDRVDLGELCLETEVIGNATVLANLLVRQNQLAAGLLSFHSSHSLTASGGDALAAAPASDLASMDDEETVFTPGQHIRTTSTPGNNPQWPGDRFQLQLAYPALLSDSVAKVAYRNEGFEYDVRVTVLCGRNMLNCDRNSESDPFFTIYPVWPSGEVVHAAKQQSLTVYESRNPVWPQKAFVFGQTFDVTKISHLAIHFYDRDWGDLDTTLLKRLGDDGEVDNSVWLPRHLLHKITHAGDVDRSGALDMLEFDQKVLAFRRCGDGGNYFPGRVRHYTPFPVDAYLVLFEDELDSIAIVKKLLSYDAKGEIMHVRGDGTVDVQLVGEKQTYVSRVPIRLLSPVKAFTAETDATLAKKKASTIGPGKRHSKWAKVELHVLSLSEIRLPETANAAVIVTLLSIPEAPSAVVNALGEIVEVTETTGPGKNKNQAAEAGAKAWNYTVPTAKNAALASVAPLTLEGPMLEAAAAILLRVVDQGSAAAPKIGMPVLAMAKIDIQGLVAGEPHQHLKLFPEKKHKFDTFYGALHARAVVTPHPVDDDVIDATPTFAVDDHKKGLHEWYEDVLRKEAETASLSLRSLLDPGNHVDLSYIARRRGLRAALSARQNRQVDNFGFALNAVYRHLLSVLREIALFDEYEGLTHEDQRKFSAVHTVSAQPDSDWLYRRVNDLAVHVRKKIVVDLEMHLLDLAGCKAKDLPPIPDADATLDAWLQARAARYAVLDNLGDFLPKERGFVLKYSACFTGAGLISWILRLPAVLWKDKWVDVAVNEVVEAEALLDWESPTLLTNTEAIQAPESREHALVWLKALFDAGFLESVSDKRDFADADDRFYRVHHLEHERLHQDRKDSTFPLDLVREVDCQTKSNGELFCKRLTDHAAGFLGTQSTVSTLLGSATSTVEAVTNMKLPHLSLPNVSTTLGLSSKTLWDWKYCLFVPGTKTDRKYLYMYDSVHATNASVVIDLSGAQTIVTYSNAKVVGEDCFEIRHPAYFAPDAVTNKLVKLSDADVSAVFASDVSQSIVLKATDSQVWMQALLMAGVKVTLEKRQKVLFQRLNSAVLEAKCIKENVPFSASDLEGSFQHLINRVFGHDKASQQSSDKKIKELRARIRSELKKASAEKEPVTAKYGRSGVFDPPPTDARQFSRGYEYAARICAIRTPFTDASYPFKALYKVEAAPARMKELLTKYKIRTRAAWAEAPKAVRDLFLLYDVEYHHKNETIIEKNLLREDFRTQDGDLDPLKVHDKCVDLNVVFKPHDLEGCVSLFTDYANGETPMGRVRIQLQSLSDQRELDWWLKLTPERGMLQRRELGAIRVRVEMRKHDRKTVMASLSLPPPLVAKVEALVATPLQVRPKAPIRSVLHVEIIEGRKLIVADIRTSDPYVQLYLVGTKNGKEVEIACGKTDTIPSTLNPKWTNQGFTLGKADDLRLDDKKALILRVFDHDTLSSNDPMGCLRLEFDKDHMGYIRRLKLHHAGPGGKETPTWLALDEAGCVDVFERLLRDTRAGQPAWAKARGNSDDDGVLGRLRFRLKLTQHDFTEADTPIAQLAPSASPLKPRVTPLVANAAHTNLTRHGLVVTVDNISLPEPKKGKPAPAPAPEADAVISGLSLAFAPRSREGHLVSYDLHGEQSTHDNKRTVHELVNEPLVLGFSYDIGRVASYDIVLHNAEKGVSFVGSLPISTTMAETRVDVECANRDPKDKLTSVVLCIHASYVGLHRAEYVQRVLSETYQYAGLEFDPRAAGSLGETAEDFLWETCHVAVSPGQNVSGLLFAQLERLYRSLRLHWQRTPKLLFFLLHHELLRGKGRLPYAQCVPLDNVLLRWSAVLSAIAEAKSQLTGRLHGELTPRLITTLSTLCDWSGATEDVVATTVRDMPRLLTVLHVGDRVHAYVPGSSALVLGSPVDVDCDGVFYAGRIATLYSDGHADVMFLPSATPSPLIREGDSVYIFRVAGTWETQRSGRVAELKATDDGFTYRVVFPDESETWLQRSVLVAYASRLRLATLHPPLLVNTCVRVVHNEANRAARVQRAHGNATYDVVFLEGSGPPSATVPRADVLTPPTHLCRGTVTHVCQAEDGLPSYDLVLENANVVAKVPREGLRLEALRLCTDDMHVCAAFIHDLACGSGPLAATLKGLWGHLSVIQTYLELPEAIASVGVRDPLTGAATPLVARSDAPKFHDQYHGYVLGPQWSEGDKIKTASLQRMKPKDLPLKRLVSVVLAPVPYMVIQGIVTIVGADTVAFRAAMEQRTSMVLSEETRRLVGSWVHASLPIDAAPTTVTITTISNRLSGKPVKDVVLSDAGTLQATYESTGKTLKDVPMANLELRVGFEVRLRLPEGTDSPMADAAGAVLEDANRVVAGLHAQTLVAFSSSGELVWSSDSDDVMAAPTEQVLRVKVTNQLLTGPPEVSWALSPLQDVRLVVSTDAGKQVDVTLSVAQLQEECRLRHELLPRYAATVVQPPSKETNTVGVRFADAKDGGGITTVDMADVALDTLHVQIVKAHDLHTTISTRKGSVGDYMDEDIHVRAYVVTTDIPSNAGGKNKVGLTVNADGAVVKDLTGTEYPKLTDSLRSTHVVGHKPNVDWAAAKKLKKFSFGQPKLPLDYVTKLVLEVVSTGYGSPITGQNTTSGTCIGYATIDIATLPKHERETTVALFRKGFPEDHEPRGSLAVRLHRETTVDTGATVMVRRASSDKWVLCQHELVLRSLRYKTKHAERGLVDKLAAELLPASKPVEQEGEVQKLLQLVRLQEAQKGFTARARTVVGIAKTADLALPAPAPMTLSQIQMKDLVAASKATAEAVAELLAAKGASLNRRKKWSADYVDEVPSDTEHVAQELRSPFEVVTDRLRATLLKLHYVSANKLIPQLDAMAAMSVATDVSVQEAEKILTFFEDEVDDLDEDDAAAFALLDKKTRVAKLTQFLDHLLRAYVRISVLLDHDARGGATRASDELVGVAIIPLLDLIDQREHNRQYQLHLDHKSAAGLERYVKKSFVHVKSKLAFSEVSLLECAIALLKEYKKTYIETFEAARRRVTAAVVPAQRRRWQTLVEYLERLKVQSVGKMHWEETPALLEHVWDIFLSHRRQFPSHLVAFTPEIVKYREAVVKVHSRWVNLQPKLEELLRIQSLPTIDATRTPTLLAEVAAEVEGLDILRRNAWHEVEGKWLSLLEVLEKLVGMQESNKLHLGLAPQLLKFVSDHCSKGLNPRHAEAVATVQFRWIALTKHDGPINELRLMETHGLHWRRTYDLLRLLDEQCEGFSDIDAKALAAVRARWTQVETWLHDFVEMQRSQKVHCQQTPYALRKFLLIRDHLMVRSKSTAVTHDQEQVEGMLEWYAHEESKRELIRLPHHRIKTDRDRDDWLMFSDHGRDSRLLITKQDMLMNPENVRAALIDRGVLPASMAVHDLERIHVSTGQWPTVVLDEIEAIEAAVDKDLPLENPERVVELHRVLEDIGKGDLLWKVKHCVNLNKELAVPENMNDLLFECQRRGLATTELEALLKGLATTLQKEELVRRNIPVPANASYEKVCGILVAHQVSEVPLPTKISEVQEALVARHLDKKGDAVYRRGVRVNTVAIGTLGSGSASLGIVDSHIETLRKQLLMEAMRKRNSLIKTFPVPSPALLEETADVLELDMSGDHNVLVDRFHDWLVHETYTIKLASYAAMDRCARALVGVVRDVVLTKEDMALGLQKYTNTRLPPQAFTRDELVGAARAGLINQPQEKLLALCATGTNAAAMAYYAALRTTAIVYQERSAFTARLTAGTTFGVVDAMPMEVPRDVLNATALPQDRSKLTLGYVIVDWLLGNDDTPVELRSSKSKYYIQRLQWVSAAFTIRDRWWQLGIGWCDKATDVGVGVKVLLDNLILMAGENKMHMLDAERLLKEINEKCYALRPRENDALDNILFRFNENMGYLEELVTHAERCINNRKLHSERTPELLHLIQQHCVAPKGLSTRHQEAYRVVTAHWLPHGRQLEELVQMHKDGTFSIHRTPEILEEMAHHTEGLAGTKEAVQPVEEAENNDAFATAQLTEWRKGRRKSVLNETKPGLTVDAPEAVAPIATEEEPWKPLSPINKPKANVSPFKRSVTWNFGDTPVKDEASRPASDLPILQLQLKPAPIQKKKSIPEEVCDILRSPTKWFETPKQKPARIPPQLFYPLQVARDDHV
ncbi:hypothetical protein ACHHYP_00332 [Achlya hypogyna]|uniref:Calmodulin n=1 Tax=Achlya hypogyna TaxID=1202772 RepID=A0A1V9ZUL2_ACHHY|nr:hypothetical protein ACHHYP_00332 [Achlya hypogyna]